MRLGRGSLIRCRDVGVPRTSRALTPRTQERGPSSQWIPTLPVLQLSCNSLRDSRWRFSSNNTGAFCGAFDRHDLQHRSVLLRLVASAFEHAACRCEIH
jgi:hypothetical protein